MTSRDFDPKFPLCHSKMGGLLTPSYTVSQKYKSPPLFARDVIYEWALSPIQTIL